MNWNEKIVEKGKKCSSLESLFTSKLQIIWHDMLQFAQTNLAFERIIKVKKKVFYFKNPDAR